MNPTIAEILKEQQIVIDMQATDRWQAIDELLGRLIETGTVRAESREAVASALRKREETRAVHEHRHRVWHRNPARSHQ
jgi:hypothetical protein